MQTIKTIPLESITLDDRTQQRAGELDEGIIDDYKASIEDGAQFPPIVVYFDGEKHWLADGHYRYQAEKEFGTKEIKADIRSGTLDDAILYSCGANGNHGLRRTRADICKAVATIKAHPLWSQWSNRQIAQACNVSHTFVNNWEKKYGGNVSTDTSTIPDKNEQGRTPADAVEHDHEPATGIAFAPDDKPEAQQPSKPRQPRDTCKAGELDALIDLLREAIELAEALNKTEITEHLKAAMDAAKCGN
jgi:hypothetical protein